jgi:FkbM family methyltransferase
MTQEQKINLINIVMAREKLRLLNRLARLIKDPFRSLPYYVLATLSHIKPFKISFKTLWGDTLIGFMPEVNTFYYYGYCEANLTSFLLRFLSKDSIFIDIGAHVGFYSNLVSRLVGDSGKVYSFEPTPWTYKLLQVNTSNLKNVISINAGAADSDGNMNFSDYGPGYGAYNSGSSAGTILRQKPKKISIPIVQLDKFFEQKAVRPDFIKIDAEGTEYQILNGLEETLKTSRPLITLEMAGDERWAKNCKMSSDILSMANYDSYEMTDDGFIKKCKITPPYTYTNFLFVPTEKTNTIKDLII